MKKRTIIFILILMVSVSISFIFGTIYSKNKQKANFPGAIMQSGNFSGSGYGINRINRNSVGNILNGEILSKDDTMITLKSKDGGSKIIFFSNLTKVSKTIDAVIDDLKTGNNIIVSGKTNSDGSVMAESIQIKE